MANSGLNYYWARLNIAERLIAINVLVFILAGLCQVLFLIDVSDWFHLPKEFNEFIFQPWGIVTYSFFHGGFWHLLFNMVFLYFAGRMVLNLFQPKTFLSVYFLGAILGGLIFLLSYNLFPGLVGSRTPGLVGASAGVISVLIFICAYIPNQEVRLFGLFNIKLWYIGAFFVLMDLIQIRTGDNVGGKLAHLGGAFLGFLYARQLMKGNDIGSGFEKLMDGLGGIFARKEKKSPLKTVYKNAQEGSKNANYDKAVRQKKIDTILDKISKSGYESLSKAEKDFLFKAGKED
ncbi:rhomboid family protein [Croceivirga thetidis]|uniref:Rhomboid family intramembrane serine protease n=1 Tax=Croceivirga thetidis TaxID=2721623 RepID=A0ABX1GSC1_9FLAO|nr:rhomboid family intramembrane serine protease [Croceivirga thetidis]NKI32821.1 rhomboid family intramembrane serine protease [Croceivirga thetidis]